MLKAQGRQDVSGFEVDCARRRRQTRQLYPSQSSQPFAICILKQSKCQPKQMSNKNTQLNPTEPKITQLNPTQLNSMVVTLK